MEHDLSQSPPGKVHHVDLSKPGEDGTAGLLTVRDPNDEEQAEADKGYAAECEALREWGAACAEWEAMTPAERGRAKLIQRAGLTEEEADALRGVPGATVTRDG